MPTWKAIGASVRGPDHEEAGLPCQDAFTHAVAGPRLIAAVSDGAGSARYSDRGARILCDTVVAELFSCRAPLAGETSAPAWRTAIEAAVEKARADLTETIAADLPGDPSACLADYGATLIGAVAEPEGGLFFHIGDGIGAAVPDIADWAACALSRPENGEFANETYFFTRSDWRDRLRMTAFGPCALIVMASDGAMPFTVAERFVGLEGRFLGPVTAFLDAAPPEIGRDALAGTLDRKDARRISGDDKTVLWARLRAEECPAG